ncbi:HlyD family efflux transporter periplasmic adaptor subunit [Tuwongella immobilis]|uniref:HlyD family efflux transporter periplasmic adaptor subunit n=1 Tax=Tuwongella immobilis TaxID=692036 RepID=UPI0013A6CDB1|nr:HlyD family efflux transporter periplasmic adaptor subunit [Tuwongella immobilis]
MATPLGLVIALLGLFLGGYATWQLQSLKPATAPSGSPAASGAAPSTSTSASAESASVPSQGIFALAKLEPEGGILQIGGLPGDRILEIMVQPGQEVRENQPLIRLASYEVADAELALLDAQKQRGEDLRRIIQDSAQAQDAEAQAKIAQARASGKIDLQLADKKIQLLEGQTASAQDLLARLQQSGQSRLEIEKQDSLLKQLQSELESARISRQHAVEAAERSERLAELQRTSARKNVDRLLMEIPAPLPEAVRLATLRRRNGEINAPIAGKILSLSARRGELVGQFPLMQLADTKRMIAIAEVYETSKAELEQWLKQGGVRAELESALIREMVPEKKLTGTVQRVGSMIGRNQLMPLDPVQDADRRIFEVRVLLDQPDLASRMIHHQATIRLLPKQAEPAAR